MGGCLPPDIQKPYSNGYFLNFLKRNEKLIECLQCNANQQENSEFISLNSFSEERVFESNDIDERLRLTSYFQSPKNLDFKGSFLESQQIEHSSTSLINISLEEDEKFLNSTINSDFQKLLLEPEEKPYYS